MEPKRLGQPRVVIVGAGIVGCGVADELAARGVGDITLIERGPWPRPGGSTSHAPGLVFQTNASETMTRFATYTLARIDELSFEGQPCALRVGSLEVATDADRWAELHRRAGWANARGVEARLVDPATAAGLHNLVEPDRILGALHVPSDGWVRPHDTAAALAHRSGARLLTDTTVMAITSSGARVTGVDTIASDGTAGHLDADVVVCCAGLWGPQIGAMAGVAIALQPMAHQYALTGTVPALAHGRGPDSAEVGQPLLRHQSAGLYFREHGDQLGIGSYAHRPIPVDVATIGRDAVGMPSVLAFTPEDFAPSWAAARWLLADLDTTEVVEGINGIFSFTPDGAPLLGPAKELDGFWVAEAIWITHSLGAARAVAEGICAQAPTLDVHECDLERFEPAARTAAAVRPQAVARFAEVYDIIHPLTPPGEPRNLRVSPFHARQVALGAEMLVGSGWERPQWYEANAGLLDATIVDDGPGEDGGVARPQAPAGWAGGRGPWASRHWSPIVGAEHRAGRRHAGLYDMTSLRRLEVSGPGALGLLDRLTTTRMDKKPGSVTYSLMLDHHGGIRSDVTVARLDEDRFWVGTNGPADQAWIDAHARHAVAGGGPTAIVRDITGARCCVGLWGPTAPTIIEGLLDQPLDGRYFSAASVHVGDVAVTALRVSYVGEVGWELYAGSEYGQRLWDLLWDAGRPHGLVAVGRGALDAMRIEKGYRAWGRDMTAVDTPAEAGLDWAVDLRRDFIGRESLEARAMTRRLRTITLDDAERVVLGGEGVFHAGRAVGSVTSAAYGASVGRTVAYAWLPPELAPMGTAVEVSWFDERLAAHVADDVSWDPDGKRVRMPLTTNPGAGAGAGTARTGGPW